MRLLLRNERGTALISAVVLLGVMAMLGLAVVSLADTQNQMSGQERVRENAFAVGEAALNAQVFQLARNFPHTAPGAFPSSCSPTATPTGCPDGNDMQGFTSGDYQASCAGTAITRWTTSVRDNSNGAEQYYTKAIVDGNATWDSNNDGVMWARADGRAGCRLRSMVTQVKVGVQPISFPRSVVSANWFRTTNLGRKVILDTQGNAGEPADVSVRCTTPLPPSGCLGYDPAKGQIQPDTTPQSNPAPSPLLDNTQIEPVKALARSLGRYFAPGSPSGTCPTNLTAELTYVEDFTTCAQPSGPRVNSQASPGFLVIGKGTLTFTGNTTFYGMIYMRNEQGSSGSIVNLSGTGGVVGAVMVDGLGGVTAGSSGGNIKYDSRAQGLVKGLSTAAAVPNSWRELRAGS